VITIAAPWKTTTTSKPNMVNTQSKNITGGARGIGRVIARHLLSQPLGHRVFLVDLNAEELEYVVTKHLAAYAPRVGSIVANLRNPKAIREAVAKAAEFFDDRIDVLVNNAGTLVKL
jgi:NAD(P)-dependent dehydrogenase (short-subunit alcohol dehydrogenase family)